MTGYWHRSYFACLWTETLFRSINTQKKKNEANIQLSSQDKPDHCKPMGGAGVLVGVSIPPICARLELCLTSKYGTTRKILNKTSNKIYLFLLLFLGVYQKDTLKS